MYSTKAGNYQPAPETPVERAEYYLEQMQEYLDRNRKDTDEYNQVQIIFEALLNVMTEKNYKSLATALTDTSKRINMPYGRCGIYWSEFLKFMHYKLTM